MAEASHGGGGGVKGFLGKETAGLPNWGWLVVIAAGLGAAIILPKLFGGGSQQSQQNQQQNQQGNQPPDNTQGTSGLGLAIDPTTGLPYAVEGLVPGGAQPGTPGTTTTTATDSMTATNDLLTQLLNQIKQGPTPVQVTNPVKVKGTVPVSVKGTPTFIEAHPTVKKTTSTAKVSVSSGVATTPIPRPSGPTQPTQPIANPVSAGPKVFPFKPPGVVGPGSAGPKVFPFKPPGVVGPGSAAPRGPIPRPTPRNRAVAATTTSGG